MPATIGFVILVNPLNPLAQAERLIGTLNRMFDLPPIACHLDFGQNAATFSRPTSNVQVVHPYVKTKWADFSCIEAAIRALRLLYVGGSGPEWFVYLSGADYPIKSAAKILADLQADVCDGHVEHRLIRYNHYQNWWQAACHKRFCSVEIKLPWMTRRFAPVVKNLRFDHPWITRGRLPYSEQFPCYAGEAWFCARQSAARSILDFHDRDVALAAHCRKVKVPEETYFHTVLGNDPTLTLDQNHLRYVDWKAFGSHPKTLGLDDLPAMLTSPAHFARKFSADLPSPVLDELDKIIT